MNGFVGHLLANKHTNDSLKGLGALKGAPCVLESITPISIGNRTGNEITFKWTSENGVEERTSFQVMNGLDGVGGGDGDGCDCEEIQDITDAEINDICKI